MDANTLYYTFSTISQTLAGAIGLLGAFVLYRIQSLNEAMRNNSKVLKEKMPVIIAGYHKSDYINSVNASLDISFAKENYNEFIEIANNIKDENNKFFETDTAKNFLKIASASIHFFPLKNNLIKELKKALILTVILISYSVIVLALTPIIVNSCNILPAIILTLGVFGMVLCLVLYSNIVYTAIKEKIEKSDKKEIVKK